MSAAYTRRRELRTDAVILRFTSLSRAEYLAQRDQGLMKQDGCYLQFITPHGTSLPSPLTRQSHSHAVGT